MDSLGLDKFLEADESLEEALDAAVSYLGDALTYARFVGDHRTAAIDSAHRLLQDLVV